jgi:hypothetical protein
MQCAFRRGNSLENFCGIAGRTEAGVITASKFMLSQYYVKLLLSASTLINKSTSSCGFLSFVAFITLAILPYLKFSSILTSLSLNPSLLLAYSTIFSLSSTTLSPCKAFSV